MTPAYYMLDIFFLRKLDAGSAQNSDVL